MIPRDFVQTLLARVDIVDVIQGYIPLKKGGANYMARCPFHDEKSASFSVSPTKQFYYCFGCGATGSAVGFLIEYAGLSFPDAVRSLADQVGMQVPEDRQVRAQPTAPPGESGTDMLRQALDFYRAQLRTHPPAIDYLKRRGLTGQVAARFGLGYAPAGWRGLEGVFKRYDHPMLVECGLVIEGEQGKRYDRFRDRVMFPILDQRGGVIGFGGRVMDQGEPKYLNSPETPLFEKGRELYGLFQAKPAIRAGGTVVVVEGYMDVVALAQHGIAYAVATLGTATTPHHLERLLRLAERVVFSFDGDKAGRRAARRALEVSLSHLKDGKDVAFLFLPAEHDPDSYVREHGAPAFEAMLAQATPLSRFLVEELQREHPQDHAEGRAGLLHQAVEWIAQVRAPALSLLLRQVVAEAVRVPRSDLDQLLVAIAPKPMPGTTAPDGRARRGGELAGARRGAAGGRAAGANGQGAGYGQGGQGGPGHGPLSDGPPDGPYGGYGSPDGYQDLPPPFESDGDAAYGYHTDAGGGGAAGGGSWSGGNDNAGGRATGGGIGSGRGGQGGNGGGNWKGQGGRRRVAPPAGYQGRREVPTTLEDRLLACLLHAPELVHAADPDPADAELAAPALAAMATFIRGCVQPPNLAAFIEAFRDGPFAPAIERAMRRELPAMQTSEALELREVLDSGLAKLLALRTQQRGEQERIALIALVEAGTATNADRDRLRVLLSAPPASPAT